jgi:hypothetical protein
MLFITCIAFYKHIFYKIDKLLELKLEYNYSQLFIKGSTRFLYWWIIIKILKKVNNHGTKLYA